MPETEYPRGKDMNDVAMAFDKSVRRFDEDGRMHVETTPISKAAVNEYFGREIPDAERLGLQPDRKYKLLRHPDELKAGADTFNNVPLMIKHIRQSAEEPQKDKVVGSTGTDAEFDKPHLKNSLVIWDKDAIDGIQNSKRRQLSCSYRYDADMTPGTYEGETYDGVMRNIRANHVALVEEGRAGPDVLVSDSLPPTLKDTTMKVSRRAIVAQGALAGWLAPKLANDAKLPDLKSVLLGTTAQNWKDAKPQIVTRLTTAVTGRLAKDAKLEDVHKLLDSLDREGEDNMEPDEMDVVDRKARDEDPEEKRKREEQEASDKAARDKARDEDPDAETEEERKARMEKRAADKAAKDKAAKDKAARDAESPEDREKREAEEKKMREKERAEDKAAYDAAIQTALQAERQRQADIREAERAARPYIGEIVMAQDSAEAVYRLALGTIGVKHEGIHPSALRAVLDAHPKPGSGHPRLAHDAAASKSFAEQFPTANRIRSI